MSRPRSRLSLAPAGLALVLLAGAACADVPPSGLLIDVWDTEDGLPSRTVTSLAQTSDGYLWVGTYNGFARCEGAPFVTLDPVNTPEPALEPTFDANDESAESTMDYNTIFNDLEACQ